MNRYGKMSVVLCGLVFGAWCGEQMVDAQALTCAVKCEETKAWTSYLGPNDMAGIHYRLVFGTLDGCKRHWVAKTGRSFTGLLNDKKKYKQLDAGSSGCTIERPANGGIEGLINCTTPMHMGMEMDKECYRECTSNFPMPPTI